MELSRRFYVKAPPSRSLRFGLRNSCAIWLLRAVTVDGTLVAGAFGMSFLERLIPTPRLLEIDHVDLAASSDQVWAVVRHGDLGRSPLIRALFAIRALPGRLSGREAESSSLRIAV